MVDRRRENRFTLKVDANELHLLGRATQPMLQPAQPEVNLGKYRVEGTKTGQACLSG